MKIKKLTLKGYKRFDLLGCDIIEYTPESPYQLIVGKNGIGKSSLTNELSPLPCESMDLKEGGYKEIIIEHRGHLYTLTNTLNRKLNSSFVRDGIELNEGGTTKAQKDLVLEHFRYDSNLHDVLVGNTLLTNMTPQQRREWFVKMSKSDIAYVIGLFNKIKGTDRDIKGALKLNNQRLLTEKNRLPTNDDIVRVKKESDLYRNELNELLPNLDNSVRDKSEELERGYSELTRLSEQVVNLNSNLSLRANGKVIKGENGILQFIHETTSHHNHVQDSYRKSLTQLAELQDIVVKQQELNSRTLPMIEEDIKKCSEQIGVYADQYKRIDIEVGESFKSQFEKIDAISSQYIQLWVSLPSNPMNDDGKRLYQLSEYDNLSVKQRQLRESIIKDENRLSFYKRELKNLEDVHDVDCPCCKYKFKPGVDRARIVKGKECIIDLDKHLTELKDELSKLEVKISEYDTWISARNAIFRFHDTYPYFNNLFNWVANYEGILDNPYIIQQMLPIYREALFCMVEMERLEKVRHELVLERERRMAAEGVDMEFIYTSITKLERSIQQYQLEMNTLSRLLNDAKAVLGYTRDATELSNSLISLITNYRKDCLDQVKFRNNETLKGIIATKQGLLANNENFLKMVYQSEGVIQQMETTNKELMEEQKSLQILATILSPQDGLIAESLIGFINKFLDNLVNVLDQIWSYPMRPYLDLGEDGIELDYRFPVEINEGDIMVKDVGKLSRGQKEVVDFVFKLLLMQYLELNDYPLIMDEVGGSFDDLHRDRLYRYVKLLVESNQLQQAFIISHIASSHDALSTADKIVLDTDATMIDSNVNKVILFK